MWPDSCGRHTCRAAECSLVERVDVWRRCSADSGLCQVDELMGGW